MRIVSSLCKGMIYPLLANSGYLRWHARDNPPAVITYHGVLPSAYKIDRYLDGALVSEETFERQISFLVSNYEVITPEQFRLWIVGETQLPPRSVLLTCDDGQLNQSNGVAPILKKFGLACLFFVVDFHSTSSMLWHEKLYLMLRSKGLHSQAKLPQFELNVPGLIGRYRVRSEEEMRQLWRTLVHTIAGQIDRDGQLEQIRFALGLDPNWDGEYYETPALRERFLTMTAAHLKDLVSMGMTVGSHSLSHAQLSRLSLAQSRKEIADSRAGLKNVTDTAVWAFAYPFGDNGSFGARECREVETAGYSCAFTNGASGRVGPANRFLLPRIHVTRDMRMAEFEAHVSGFYDYFRAGLCTSAETLSNGFNIPNRRKTDKAAQIQRSRRATEGLGQLAQGNADRDHVGDEEQTLAPHEESA